MASQGVLAGVPHCGWLSCPTREWCGAGLGHLFLAKYCIHLSNKNRRGRLHHHLSFSFSSPTLSCSSGVTWTVWHEPSGLCPGGEGMRLYVPLSPVGTASSRESCSSAETWLPTGGSSCFTATRRADIFLCALTPIWPWAFKTTKYIHMPLTQTELRHCLNAYRDAKCPATHAYTFWSSSWHLFHNYNFSANSGNSNVTWSTGFAQKVFYYSSTPVFPPS